MMMMMYLTTVVNSDAHAVQWYIGFVLLLLWRVGRERK